MPENISRARKPISTINTEPMAERQLKIDEDGLYELIDGELVEKANVGFRAGSTASIITASLHNFVSKNKLGVVASEVSFRCFPAKPDQVRRPNISFIAVARLAHIPDEGHVPVIPDLAVDIISRGDLVYELDAKLLDYRHAKVPLVWVVNPKAKTVQVYHHGKPKLRLQASDELTGEDVLPGLAVQVAELFPS